MIACVQRVERASVRSLVPPDRWETVGAIESGLLVLVGVEREDGATDAEWMASRLAKLRVFPDDDGRMNRSLLETGGAILLVSQFTLCGDTTRGHRPSFVGAAAPELAEPIIELFAERLRRDHGIEVATGRFRTHMQVESVNDGPVTILLRSPDRRGTDDSSEPA